MRTNAKRVERVSRTLPSWKVAAEIESRQDEVLRLLDELNDRVERALVDLGVEIRGLPLAAVAIPVQSRAA